MLVASDGTHTPDGILRYDGNTGAFLGRFINIDRPFGMTYGPDGNLYVGSASSMSISRYNGVTGAFLNTFVSSGSGGLGIPWDITFGPDGNLYVATTEGTTTGILRYSGTSGAFINRFVGLPAPWGVTFGSDGNAYVSNGDRVSRFSASNAAFIDDFATGNGLNPVHVRFGSNGDLYAASVTSVRRLDGTTGAAKDIIGPYPPDDGLYGAFEVLFGSDGLLYSAPGFTSGVKRYNPDRGAFIDDFVAFGAGGLEQPRSMVFMVPEPGALIISLAGLITLRRRR